jgi:hypothetical protein
LPSFILVQTASEDVAAGLECESGSVDFFRTLQQYYIARAILVCKTAIEAAIQAAIETAIEAAKCRELSQMEFKPLVRPDKWAAFELSARHPLGNSCLRWEKMCQK